MDVICLVSLDCRLLDGNFFLDIIYLPSEDPISSAVAQFIELIPQAKLFELKIWSFPSDPDNLSSILHYMTDELIQSMISVGHNKNWTFILPIFVVFKEELHELYTDVCFTCAGWALDEGNIRKNC